METPQLTSVFIGVTTLAALIQTGIITGLYMASLKISKQAQRAMGQARRNFGTIEQLTARLERTSTRLSEFTSSQKGSLKQFETKLDQTMERLRRKIA